MTVVNIASRCRICFEESNFHCNIYSKKDSDFICLAEIINDLCQLNVHEDDGYPKYICADCSVKLCDFKCFKQKSRTTKSVLCLLKGENFAFTPTISMYSEDGSMYDDASQTQRNATSEDNSERSQFIERLYEPCIAEPQVVLVTDTNNRRVSEMDADPCDITSHRGTSPDRVGWCPRGRLKWSPNRGSATNSAHPCNSSAVDGSTERNPINFASSQISVGKNGKIASTERCALSMGAVGTVKMEPDDLGSDDNTDNTDEHIHQEDDNASLTGEMGGMGQASMDSESTATKRNKPKLIHNGYMYTFDKLSCDGDRKYWRCERKRRKCHGRLHTTLEDAFICAVGDHNHESDQAAVDVAKIRFSISKLAQESKATADEVLSKVLQGSSGEARKHLPSKDALRKIVHRKRMQGSGHASEAFLWGGVQFK